MIAIGLIGVVSTEAAGGDVRIDQWVTTYSGKYARIYTTDVNKTNGVSVTTWSNGSNNQSLPAYAGVQEVYYSANWVYIRTTGLAPFIMGPWYNNLAHTTVFNFLPVNQKAFYRISRNPTIPANKTAIGGGTIGYTVDGLSIFDPRDALAWNGSTETMVTGGGYWFRDAWVNEGVTFDPAYAHQPNAGAYHYHANPIATRYLLGDHVDFNPVSKMYTESTNAVTKHSPILGWMRDGLPLYGPYGYSSPMDTNSGIRRMVSGFVLRNGQNGTDNLTSVGRTNLPAWSLRAYNLTSGVNAPNVSTTYPLGRYTEDWAYLGDLTNSATGQKYQVGTDFDLNEYNVRHCVTPEFPSGTYAYFTTIKADGSVTFPYLIGRSYFGAIAGAGTVTTLNETVTTNFVGGASLTTKLNAPVKNGATVTLSWSSIEGGTYQVQSTTDFATWTTNVNALTATGITTQTNLTSVGSSGFYRVSRTGVASYDPVK